MAFCPVCGNDTFSRGNIYTTEWGQDTCYDACDYCGLHEEYDCDVSRTWNSTTSHQTIRRQSTRTTLTSSISRMRMVRLSHERRNVAISIR